MIEQLNQRRHDLESVLDHMPAIIGYWDRDLKNRFANRSFEEKFDIDVHKLSGMYIKDVIGEILYRKNFPFMQAVLRGEFHSFEQTVTLLNGQQVFELVNYIPDSINGEVRRFYVMVSDITELKQAEAERKELNARLQQAEKMESIGKLAGGIAHDFNNILIMLGYTELIKQFCGDSSAANSSLQKYIEAILVSGNRAKDLIEKMMLYSRTNAKAPDKELSFIRIHPVVKETVEMLQSSISRSISINYHVSDAVLNEDLCARIEPVQLHQILMSLVVNARDAIGDYGKIDVLLGSIVDFSGICNACYERFSGNYLALTVSDSGHGIGDHLQNKIFDPFFTTKDAGNGTGMDLSVIHGIVHTLGGHIVLTQQGATVSGYSRSKEALAVFAAHPEDIDLVITDQNMPELLGLDMARAMLNVRPALAVLICTGYSDFLNADIAKQNGMAGFMYDL